MNPWGGGDVYGRLLGELRALPDFAGEVSVPARAARYRDYPLWVLPTVREAFGWQQLYSHQAECAEALHSGEDAILTTGTGSGKSAAAWLEYLNAAATYTAKAREVGVALAEAKPTALYLAPTKALARDQLHALQNWINRAGLDISIGTADGDTDAEAKRWVSSRADVVFTNPDYLHYVLLRQADKWRHLFRGLHLIVLDELHYWHGLQGAHIALVLRRLLRVAAQTGANPQVVTLSATAGSLTGAGTNAFTGRACSVVAADGSPAGEHTYLVVNPATRNAGTDSETPGSSLAAAARVTARSMFLGAKVLAFAGSRNGVEALSSMTREFLGDLDPVLVGKMAGYRGGYLPRERKELEQAFRSGALRGLASTSALELGIDIPNLDMTLTCAWPGSRASFRQQSGRAGRGEQQGISVFVPAENPLDHYYAADLQRILAEPETTVFDVHNPNVLLPHLCTAAAESPLTRSDIGVFGLGSTRVFDELTQAGWLRRRLRAGEDTWYWNLDRGENPWDDIDIRGGGEQVQIIVADTGEVLGFADATRADYTLHRDAIYVHQGRVWQVRERDERVAMVTPGPTMLRTRPWDEKQIRILKVSESRVFAGGELFTGEVEVLSRVIGYDLVRLPGAEFVSSHPLQLPTRILRTHATWFTIDDVLLEELGVNRDNQAGALHAAEHASIALLPMLISCDRWDLGGLSVPLHQQTDAPTVFVYDGLSGGTGFSEHGFTLAAEWYEATHRTVAECDCDTGCPRCIQSPKCGNNNKSLSKTDAVALLNHLRIALNSAPET